MTFFISYRGAPTNDNFGKLCKANEIEAHVQYMLDCCIPYLDIEIVVSQSE